jgi:enoyl-CoA hydratase/carnithine racemase
MTNFETLVYEKKDGIAHVTLNRPQAMNTYNIQMRDDLYQILNAIKDDDEVLVSIFKGAGRKAFCAGADLSEFLTAPSPVVARQVRFERDVWGLFLSIPQPLIAALHGYVLGSGIEIALCCDIRIASEDTRFGMPEVSLGIIPAAGGTQTLPRTVGRGKALEMLLANH